MVDSYCRQHGLPGTRDTRTEQRGSRFTEPVCKLWGVKEPLTSFYFSSGDQVRLLGWEVCWGYPFSNCVVFLTVLALLNGIDLCLDIFALFVDGS
jgi:hypothetical protein